MEHPCDLFGNEVPWSITNALISSAVHICAVFDPHNKLAVMQLYLHTCEH